MGTPARPILELLKPSDQKNAAYVLVASLQESTVEVACSCLLLSATLFDVHFCVPIFRRPFSLSFPFPTLTPEPLPIPHGGDGASRRPLGRGGRPCAGRRGGHPGFVPLLVEKGEKQPFGPPKMRLGRHSKQATHTSPTTSHSCHHPR